ncbi:MAG: energy transducer TonB [bacterium]
MNHLSIIILVALLSIVGGQNQVGTFPTKHYEKDGVAFDYPANWTVIESNALKLQTVTISPGPGATQIVVIRSGGLTSACDFDAERDKVTSALIKRLATVIHASDALHGARVTTKVGSDNIEGSQLHGLIDDKPALGDVYFGRMNHQFVSLAYVRKIDDELADSAWSAVRTSLKLKLGVITVLGSEDSSSSQRQSQQQLITGGVLNGRAISLPRPDYPMIARQAHASGTVVVQVTIDESGDIIAAHAVSGHPLLQAASVAAARAAKFSPTKLCGEPVKVTGVITYNFFAM